MDDFGPPLRNIHLLAVSSQRSGVTKSPRFKSVMAFLQISADLPLGVIQTEYTLDFSSASPSTTMLSMELRASVPPTSRNAGLANVGSVRGRTTVGNPHDLPFTLLGSAGLQQHPRSILGAGSRDEYCELYKNCSQGTSPTGAKQQHIIANTCSSNHMLYIYPLVMTGIAVENGNLYCVFQS